MRKQRDAAERYGVKGNYVAGANIADLRRLWKLRWLRALCRILSFLLDRL